MSHSYRTLPWISHYCNNYYRALCLQDNIYTLLYNILKTFSETTYIFVEVKTHTHRSASRVWFVLLDYFPMTQPRCTSNSFSRTILHVTSLQFPDDITYTHHVTDMVYMKQELDTVWFDIDEILVVLHPLKSTTRS
jgi:hypothetical protein